MTYSGQVVVVQDNALTEVSVRVRSSVWPRAWIIKNGKTPALRLGFCLVAKGGIEPPTRGFSERAPTIGVAAFQRDKRASEYFAQALCICDAQQLKNLSSVY
jgi:hypothetical protein